jgi:hypothetical protein
MLKEDIMGYFKISFLAGATKEKNESTLFNVACLKV